MFRLSRPAAGNYEHMREAIQQAGASAVAAASMFHFTEQTPAEAKAALEAAGIPVRKNYVEGMKIVFRAATVAGHVMRCTALAEALKARGAETVFREHEIEPCDWLVVDHYELGAEWERAQRRMAKKIMAIDDLGREHDCDLLLDQNVLSPINPYAGRLPARARPSLARATRCCARSSPAHERAAPRNGEVRRVLVCFGGADPANHTAVALEALRPHAARLERIDVVSVAGSRGCRRRTPNTVFHPGTSDMAALLAEADLAIGAGGVMAWERACLGVPTLAFGIAPNQEPVLEALFAAGCATGVSQMLEPDAAAIAAWVPRCSRTSRCCTAWESAAAILWTGAAPSASRTRCSANRSGSGAQPRPTATPSCAGATIRKSARNRSTTVRSTPERMPRGWSACSPIRNACCSSPRTRTGRSAWCASTWTAPRPKSRCTARPAQPRPRGLIRAATAWLAQNHPEVATVTAQVLPENAGSLAAFREAGYTTGSTCSAERTRVTEPSFTIAGRPIGRDAPPFVIAEMSGNHNQSLDRALAIVDAAAKAGAHGLKMQTYTADTMTLDLNSGEFRIDDAKSLERPIAIQPV